MAQATIEYTVLYGAIASLVTALCFLYKRTSRIEARFMSQLKADSDRCEQEKIRMFTFIMSLQTFIMSLPKAHWTVDPEALLKMPQATHEDMGLREK